MRTVATILCLVFISGCGGLVLYKDDDGGTKVAEVATKTVLRVGTLGISELHVAKAKRKKEYQEYLDSLPPEEREFEKLLRALVSDESRHDYIRSLPLDQRTQTMTQLILEKERQEATDSAAARRESARAIGQAFKDFKWPDTKIITPKSTNCYTTYRGVS